MVSAASTTLAPSTHVSLTRRLLVAPLDSSRVLVGTLNLLGDGFNPFEFLATGDKAFMERYAVLLDAWEALAWTDIAPYVKALGDADTQVSVGVSGAFAALEKHCDDNQVGVVRNSKLFPNVVCNPSCPCPVDP